MGTLISHSLERLIAEFPVSDHVDRDLIPEEGWKPVENHLGTPLPSDFKGMIEVYGGSGMFGDEILVFSPFSAVARFNLLGFIDDCVASASAGRKLDPSDWPWPLWPEPAGLLPWGKGGNGEVFWWVTVGPPDRWSIAITDAKAPRADYRPGPMSLFICKLFDGSSLSSLVVREVLGSRRFSPVARKGA